MLAAVDLIAEGSCSALCLLARDADEKGKCRCRCGGQWHGALADATVEGNATPWWKTTGYSTTGFGVFEDSGSVAKFNHWREGQKAQGKPALWVRHTARRWSVVGDTWTTNRWEVRWDTLCWMNALLKIIVHSPVAQSAYGWDVENAPERVDPGRFGIDGIRRREDALVLAAALSECLYDNTQGTVRVIAAIAEAYNLGHVPLLIPT